MLFLAMYGDEVSLPQSLFISIFSMIIVFFVLLIISYLIDFTALIINSKKKDIKKETNKKSVDTKNQNNDTVVVIAAAIAAYLGTSVDNIKIKKIKRINQPNSAWTERGLISQIS